MGRHDLYVILRPDLTWEALIHYWSVFAEFRFEIEIKLALRVLFLFPGVPFLIMGSKITFQILTAQERQY